MNYFLLLHGQTLETHLIAILLIKFLLLFFLVRKFLNQYYTISNRLNLHIIFLFTLHYVFL